MLGTFAAGGVGDDARVAQASGTSNQTFHFRALDNSCHTIRVTASCSNGVQTPCTGAASVTARQCVSTTRDCSP